MTRTHVPCILSDVTLSTAVMSMVYRLEGIEGTAKP